MLRMIGEKRAIPVLQKLRKRYPKAAWPIAVKLADLGDRSIVPDAIEAYNTSSDKKVMEKAGIDPDGSWDAVHQAERKLCYIHPPLSKMEKLVVLRAGSS